MGFLRHKWPLNSIIMKKKGCLQSVSNLYIIIDFRRPVKLNPDKLLPSRAYFRFGLTEAKLQGLKLIIK